MAESKNGTAVVSVDAKERQKVFNSMPTALQKVAEQMEGKLAKGAQGVVLIRYDLGGMVNTIVEEEGTYGSGAVEKLAKYLGEKATTLYALKDFASSFERNYVGEYMLKPMADGRYLTESHWLTLRQVKKVSDREKLLKQAMREAWSANQLEDEIRSGAVQTKNVRSGGRKPNTPTSPMAGLQKMFSLSQGLANFIEVAEEAVFEKIDEASPDNISDVLLEKLESTKETAAAVKEKLEATLEHIEQNIERVRSVLEQKQEAAEEAKAAEADRDADDSESAPEPAPEPKAKKKAKGEASADGDGNAKKKKAKKKAKKQTAATA